MISNPFVHIRVGLFLAIRDIKRASLWTTLLITFVMMLTFLNLIVVRGILVGLIAGSITANRDFYSSDLLVTPLKNKSFIQNSHEIEDAVRAYSGMQSMSVRYVDNIRLESGYKDKVREDQKTDAIGALLAGIDVNDEATTTTLKDRLIAGEFITEDDIDSVVVGATLLGKYSSTDEAAVTTNLPRVDIGDKIRMIVNGNTREVIIKGVIKTKAQSSDVRVYMNKNIARQLMGRNDLYADEIAIKLNPGVTPEQAKAYLISQGFQDRAVIRTALEAVPPFVKDIQVTFALLGNVIGSIGLAVSSITIFIVIFVNAITRRKYIGILKGIGVSSSAIQISYVLQALAYAIVGTLLASILIFTLIKPYFLENPINFPFSDGIMEAEFLDVFIRACVLLSSTVIAGFVPAYLVVRQNTLDAILGR